MSPIVTVTDTHCASCRQAIPIERRVRIQITNDVYISMSESEALDMASDIVFMTCGNLIQQVRNGVVTGWNMASKFFEIYAARWESRGGGDDRE